MLPAAISAFEDVFSPRFRKVLWKSVGLTLALFVALFIGLEASISLLGAFPWPWLDTVLSVVTGLALVVALFFLMAPVTALFAGLFLDEIAETVEVKDYPDDLPGKALPTGKAVLVALQFGTLVLLTNLVLLPTLFFGVGAILMVVANAYFLGREYFSLVAMRHLPIKNAHHMRKQNMGRIFAAGFIPAGLAMIPFVSILVPLFSTSYFVHIIKKILSEV